MLKQKKLFSSPLSSLCDTGAVHVDVAEVGKPENHQHNSCQASDQDLARLGQVNLFSTYELLTGLYNQSTHLSILLDLSIGVKEAWGIENHGAMVATTGRPYNKHYHTIFVGLPYNNVTTVEITCSNNRHEFSK
jgi:hypothetical protein